MAWLKSAILERLPDNGDRLPICGNFYRDRGWTGVGRLEDVYPRWFVWCCRVEAWALLTIYRACGGKI